jgi:hypothetical protein
MNRTRLASGASPERPFINVRRRDHVLKPRFSKTATPRKILPLLVPVLAAAGCDYEAQKDAIETQTAAFSAASHLYLRSTSVPNTGGT